MLGKIHLVYVMDIFVSRPPITSYNLEVKGGQFVYRFVYICMSGIYQDLL